MLGHDFLHKQILFTVGVGTVIHFLYEIPYLVLAQRGDCSKSGDVFPLSNFAASAAVYFGFSLSARMDRENEFASSK